jgi:hypothetical protein
VNLTFKSTPTVFRVCSSNAPYVCVLSYSILLFAVMFVLYTVFRSIASCTCSSGVLICCGLIVMQRHICDMFKIINKNLNSLEYGYSLTS